MIHASRYGNGGRARWASAGLAIAAAMLLPGALAATPAPRAPARATLVLAGGCYWGVESVFRHVRGVISATSGFAVPVASASAGTTYVEAVRLEYDPARLPLRQILNVFFTVVHDPTQVNRQGPDVGPQYRSVVFASGPAERRLVRAYIDSLSAAHAFPRPITTAIAALATFRVAEASQQDYAARHPDDPYIVTYDAPRVKALERRFPGLVSRQSSVTDD